MKRLYLPIAVLALAARPLGATDVCEKLASLSLPGVSVTSAATVAAGGFAVPGATDDGGAFAGLPAFCRVTATLTPSSDSDIKIELWMPSSAWNGKYQAVGNGGFSGSINHRGLKDALARGYAASSTDTGHSGGGAAWALGHPEKVVDFGWRAVHEMAAASKQILARHYGKAPARSYWTGCSAGGRQAMKAAQRFPQDFDGIVAGAPGLDWTSRAAQAVRLAQRLEGNAAARLGQPQRELLHAAVVAACDASDGVKDGVLEDPSACAFDPGSLECGAGIGAGCLARAQVETARMMYESPPNPQTGRAVTGLARGSERGWTDLGWTASARATGLDQFRFLVFRDPAWTVERFDFARDVVAAEAADGGTLNALDPDLKPFFGRGGKLLQYHGWSDPQISPFNSIQYYERALRAAGGDSSVRGSYRLFLAPGMGHCGGGDGPNVFDAFSALEAWVDQGRAPDQIVASRVTGGVVDRTRPLCPYPSVAVYQGVGSSQEAASFACRAR